MLGQEAYNKLYEACKQGSVDRVRAWRTQYCSALEWIDQIFRLGKKDESGMTPILMAAAEGHVGVVKLLVKWRVDCNTKCSVHPNTVLHAAIESQNLEMVEVILTHGEGGCEESFFEDLDTDIWNARGDTPLIYAIKRKSYDIVGLLLKHVNPNKRNAKREAPLHVACGVGDTKIVEMLIKAKAKVNVVDRKGNTPLHVAVTEIDHVSATSCEEDIVIALIAAGANINKRNKKGITPLHDALEYGSRWTVKILFQGPVKIHKCDKEGETYLHYAIKCDMSSLMHVLASGVNVNQPDKHGRTPLWYAIRKGGDMNVVKTLLLAGADPNIIDNKGSSVRVFDGNPIHFPAIELLDLMPLPLQSLSQMQVRLDRIRAKRQKSLYH